MRESNKGTYAKKLRQSETFDRIVAIRRDIHQHPELSGNEKRTAEVIEKYLMDLGLNPYRLCETAVICDLPGKNPSLPYIALRADTDALPIHEETGLSFSSIHDGIMHACGHDAHTAMLMGAAEILSKREPLEHGIRLIWQPAEETATGAKELVDAGILENVALIFGGHVDRHYDPGMLAVTEGAVNASADIFEIEINGQQAHGARPHESLDAVVVGSLLVTAIQTIVSREIDPSHPSVLTVGEFHAGTACNVIAGKARLTGTIRSQEKEVRDRLASSLERITYAIGQLHGANIKIKITPVTPPLINSKEMTLVAKRAAALAVGEENITTLRTANMGGEDFAFFLQHVQGAYIRFGSLVEGLQGHPAHSSKFDVDEQALATGAAWFIEVAKEANTFLLSKRNSHDKD
ncbi:MAG: amidohydrolase [Deltaproteobacteria bacterium]|nr:MAG: amidohydrolase [Deltaproteobacteria bacterium]